ncbi:MAG: peptidyl-prolyl cis-trans isomerase [Deltaproteobacteria bacterium]|nr:peptidyl-prolyl cis-trans isomerase [Deltaproteobacteria bacterium]
MKPMQRLLREPLLHFSVLGSLIFLVFALVSGPPPVPVDTIVIGPERIEQLSKGFQAAWRRPPSADELSAIIDDAVREEVYYREAVALGLDTNDTIVRRRLRQKMEFLLDSGAELLTPVAGELEDHLLANEATFRLDSRLAFEQIYLGRDPDQQSTERLLSELQADSAAEVSSLGEHTLLPAQLGLSAPAVVDGVFGEGFFGRLAELPHGVWAGPVASGYGAHLVRIGESQAARTPALEEIRESLLRDWRAAKARELRELHYAQLRERYLVEIHHAATEAAESR